MNTRIEAVRVTFEGHAFASQIEARTYKALRLYLAKEEIEVHHHVAIFPPTARFKSLGWNVDFYIPKLDLYIEAKGLLRSRDNREFFVKAHVLERLRPEVVDNLLIVSDTPGQSLWLASATIGIEKMKQIIKLKLSVK